MPLYPIHLVLSCGTLLYEIFCIHFWSKIIVLVFVPSTPAKWISFYNHRNVKVAEGKHNVLVLYMNACVPDPFGSVLWNPFIWDILLLFILIENRVVCFCAFHTSKMNFILQPQEQKSCGRQTHYSSTLCGCYCTQSIWCCPVQPSIYEIVWVQNIYISLLLYIPPGKLEHRIYSLSSLGHISCGLEASSFQTTITLDVIAFYPCFPKLLKDRT